MRRFDSAVDLPAARDLPDLGVDGVVVGLGVVLAAALVALAHPLPGWWTAVAIALHLASNGQYAVAVVRRRARPNVVTWLLWGLTPMVAVAAEIGDRPGPEVAVTFAVGLGPLVVAAVALCTDRSASRLTPFSGSCAAAAVVGVVAWQLTPTPTLAVAFCILADVLATLPTLRKAYDDPSSEHAPPYLLAIGAMLRTLGAADDPDFTAYGFPLYVLLVNVVLFAFAAFPVAEIARWAGSSVVGGPGHAVDRVSSARTPSAPGTSTNSTSPSVPASTTSTP